jgi:oligoribonuclease NrnB/cAMP/cGMP phosphodiesterase (DHH superfamily)
MLFKWEEFLEYLFDKWFKYRKNRLHEISKPLSVYTDLFDIPAEQLTKAQLEEYKRTYPKYARLYTLTLFFDENYISKYNEIFDNHITTIEDFFDSCEKRVKDVIVYYEYLLEGVHIPEWKFTT